LTIEEIFSPQKAALAPLAGVSDSVFRRICIGFGARPVITEMISADGFIRCHPSDKSWRLVRFNEEEHPIGIQFFGSDPVIMAEAIEKALALKPDFIDINAGCPVKKVISRGAGSALMRNQDLLMKIVGTAVEVSGLPVTVKIRAGWDNSTINAVETAQLCKDAGAKAIILHPRTKAQGFSGLSDWSLLSEVKQKVSIPLIGSGDIKNAADALRMKNETGVDYIMVGRASFVNPWIFREINAALSGHEETFEPSLEEKFDAGLRQLDMLSEEVSPKFALLNMRKFFGWYSKGVKGGAEFRKIIFVADSIDKVKEIVSDFKSRPHIYESEEDATDYIEENIGEEL
jgi:tRNA-dihydrouridine synthase B